MKKKLASAIGILLLTVGIAKAGNPPEQREGLWSIHKVTIDDPGNKKTESTSTICRSHAYDEHVRSLAKSRKDCTTVSESFEGGKYFKELSCEIAGTKMHSKVTTVFQGDTSTHSENYATYTPAMAGISDSTMIMDQKYVGSCPAGTQPGDMTDSDGTATHLWKH